MAIIDNRATEIGDVILVKAEAPVVGVIAFTSFSDTLTGETATRFFDKEFRYSTDGIIYTTWQTLNIVNVQAVNVNSTDIFYIEYKYIRAGTDPSGELEFNSVTLIGDVVEITCGKTFNTSIFKEYFNCDDLEATTWAVNVSQKLYDSGTIPEFITRNQQSGQNQDQDFKDYWYSISLFFAFLVKYSRVFKNFYLYEDLLKQYLTQKGLFYCPRTLIGVLEEIKKNILKEHRRRGTIAIYQPLEVTGESRHGELLRLICYDKDTEFLLGVANQACATWNLDNTSPNYKGLNKCLHLVKGYEWQKDVEDLTVYPLLEPSGTIDIFTDGTIDVMRIDNIAAGDISGIGDTSQLSTKNLVVDSGYNYEITFQVKMPVSADSILTFGCFGYDINDNPVDFYSAYDGAAINTFFIQETLNLTGKYYFVRGILYNSDEPNLSLADATLNIGYGRHLRFNSNIVKIIPYIVLDNSAEVSTSEAIYLSDIKINPVSLNYSHSYLDNGKWIDVILKNKNGSLTNEELEEVMRDKFLPYNSSFHNIYL
jgi:hypothetical protein